MHQSAPKVGKGFSHVSDPLGQRKAAKQAALEMFRNAAKIKGDVE